MLFVCVVVHANSVGTARDITRKINQRNAVSRQINTGMSAWVREWVCVCTKHLFRICKANKWKPKPNATHQWKRNRMWCKHPARVRANKIDFGCWCIFDLSVFKLLREKNVLNVFIYIHVFVWLDFMLELWYWVHGLFGIFRNSLRICIHGIIRKDVFQWK